MLHDRLTYGNALQYFSQKSEAENKLVYRGYRNRNINILPDKYNIKVLNSGIQCHVRKSTSISEQPVNSSFKGELFTSEGMGSMTVQSSALSVSIYPTTVSATSPNTAVLTL
jgi:hypothetical protein